MQVRNTQLKLTEKNPPAKQGKPDKFGNFLILTVSLCASYSKLTISQLKEKPISMTSVNTRTD